MTYTRPSTAADVSIRLTYVRGGTPGTEPMTLVHVDPPSRVTWRFPSSVPTYRSPGECFDSPNAVMLPYEEIPSFRDRVSSVTSIPMIGTVSRSMAFVRSGLASSQVMPRSGDRIRWLPPR